MNSSHLQLRSLQTLKFRALEQLHPGASTVDDNEPVESGIVNHNL